jgi:hypothetical protein
MDTASGRSLCHSLYLGVEAHEAEFPLTSRCS